MRSLERPGGNVTGITNLDVAQPTAQLALMSSVLPQLERVAILSDSTIPGADAAGLRLTDDVLALRSRPRKHVGASTARRPLRAQVRFFSSAAR